MATSFLAQLGAAIKVLLATKADKVVTQPLSITATNAVSFPPIFRIQPRDVEVNGVMVSAANPTDKWVDSIGYSDTFVTQLAFNDLSGVGGDLYPNKMIALTNLSLPELVNVGGNFTPSNMGSVTLSFPALANVGKDFNPYNMGANTLSFPALANVGGNFTPGNMGETTLSFPELKVVGGYFHPAGMVGLETVSLPKIERIGTGLTSGNALYFDVLTDNLINFALPETLKQVGGMAGNVVFTSCKLNQASVDNILIRLAALDGTNGTVAFSNRIVTITGTSSTPSAAGLSAKATLVSRGCTVTHK